MQTELVGRETELAFLDQCLAEVLDRHARLVLCRGEPGIGKTRLAEEVLALAAGRDATGLSGVADESAGAPPYWPWRQILRSLDKLVDLTAIAREHELSADLAAIAPDAFAAGAAWTPANGSPEDRFRQFDAFGQLLGHACRCAPLVIVLDDAHWADQPSLLLLRHLARTLRDARLLVLVNYRATEPAPGSVIVELLREPLTRQLDLRGLPAEAVGRQLAMVLGYDVGASQVQHVHALTGGNPFFAGEVARALAAATSASAPLSVTANVREAISARLDRLSADSARLLRAASVVGPRFSLAVVASMTGLPAARCLAALDEAVAAGLVETGSSGGYQFVHTLVRDAVEAGLGTPERTRLHRTAAESLEELHADRLEPHLFELARHWAAAAVEGDRSRAVGWIRRAAEAAMRQHAYEEAARLFHRALDSCWSEYEDEGRVHLLLGLGAARHLSSDIPGGLAACGEAAELAARIGRPDLLAEAALVTEPVYGLAEVNGRIQQLCEDALRAVGTSSLERRARVLARFAEACDYLDDVETARPASEAALALAEQLGDPAVLEAALRARQLTCAGPDALDERSVVADRMIGLGSELGSPNARMWGHLWRVDAAFQRGDFAGAARDLEAAGRSAEQVRGPLARWHVLRGKAMLAQAQARFDDARRLAEEAFATLAPTGHPSAPMMRSALLSMTAHHVGYLAEGAASHDAVDSAVGDLTGPTAAVIQALAPAFWLFEVGRVPEAAALYRSCGPVTEWRPAQHSTLFCYATGVVLAVGLDAADDVARLRELLQPYAGEHVVSGAGPVGYLGPVDLWLGVAAGYLGLFADAIAHLEHAAKACAVAGAAGFHAEVQCELADVLARRDGPGDRTRAKALAGESLRQARVLGMPPVAAKASRLIERLEDARSASRLTPREREVAELVAEGLTNREIAGRLQLSDRTAQNHVQHILDKLDLPNRGQIAVWVTSHKMSMPVE